MTTGRPLGYDPDKVLEAAMQVFWLKGYEATSLQDLLKAMGLSKSSFYQAFSGKMDLFMRCMNRYCDMVSQRLIRSLDEAESGRKFIEATLYRAAGEAATSEIRKGCLLMNTATEFAQKDPEMAERVKVALGGLKSIFAAAVRRGQKEGEISGDINADMLADYLVTCTGGIKTVVKGGADEHTLHNIITIIMRAL